MIGFSMDLSISSRFMLALKIRIVLLFYIFLYLIQTFTKLESYVGSGLR